MKGLIGALLILAGICLGLYVGVWVCLIGGIIDIINELKAPRAVETLTIAWGIVKIMFASLFGWLSAIVLIIPGFALVSSDNR